MNKLRIHERIWTPCRLCRRYTQRCQKRLWNVHTCMHWCLRHLFSTHYALHKNTHTPAQARPCDSAATSSPCKQLVQFRNLSSAQETVGIHASLWRSRSCVVTQTLSDHLSWCGAHPVFLWFAFKAWPRSLFITNFYFHFFFCRVVGFHHCTRGV